jgi:hypothetical protein
VLVWQVLPGKGSTDTLGSLGSGSTGSAGTSGTGSAGSTTGTSGTGSTAGTGVVSDSDLLTPAGVRAVVKALKPVMGGSKIVSLTVYPTYAIAEAPAESDKTGYDNFEYRDGTATRTGAGGSLESGKPLINLDSVTWDVLPAMIKTADRKLKVPKPTMRYLIVQPDILDDKPSLYFYETDNYGGGYLETDLKGRVTRVYPKGS